MLKALAGLLCLVGSACVIAPGARRPREKARICHVPLSPRRQYAWYRPGSVSPDGRANVSTVVSSVGCTSEA